MSHPKPTISPLSAATNSHHAPLSPTSLQGSLPSRRRFFQWAGATALPLAIGWPSLADGQDAATELVTGPPPLPADDCFTIAVLPDTQNYCSHFPDQYLAQTRWIADQAAQRRIACVLHLGDITNFNTPAEWQVATQAMHQLDGHVPYFMAAGNHDYSEGGRGADRSTRFNDYFPVARYRDTPNFGGVYDAEPEQYQNSFHLFSAGGTDYLVLSLEFGPRNDVLRWAGEVVAAHPQRKAILITHAYMYSDETRYDWDARGKDQPWNPHAYGVAKATDGDVNDGEQIWQKLVKNHPSFIMTLNGHVLNDGLATLVSQGDQGNDVTQMLVNFQMKPKGGDGWLRLLEVHPSSGQVRVYDYSPTLDLQNQSPQNRFDFRYTV